MATLERAPWTEDFTVPKELSGMWEKYKDIYLENANAFDVDPALLLAMTAEESAGDTNAVSPKGAKGLMQLMDATAADLGVTDPFDPAQNIRAGAWYIKQQLDGKHADLTTGNLDYSLAAYNGGAGNVKKHGGVMPWDETQNYVKDVKTRYHAIRGDGGDVNAADRATNQPLIKRMQNQGVKFLTDPKEIKRADRLIRSRGSRMDPDFHAWYIEAEKEAIKKHGYDFEFTDQEFSRMVEEQVLDDKGGPSFTDLAKGFGYGFGKATVSPITALGSLGSTDENRSLAMQGGLIASSWLDANLRPDDAGIRMQLAMAGGSALSYLIPGIGAWRAFKGMSFIARASANAIAKGGAIGKTIKWMGGLQGMGASGTMSVLESLSEVGSIMQNEIAAGGSDEDAYAAGWKAFGPNMFLLSATNLPLFSPLGRFKKATTEFFFEGFQEMAQGNIGDWAVGEKKIGEGLMSDYWMDFFIGGTIGGAMGLVLGGQTRGDEGTKGDKLLKGLDGGLEHPEELEYDDMDSERAQKLAFRLRDDKKYSDADLTERRDEYLAVLQARQNGQVIDGEGNPLPKLGQGARLIYSAIEGELVRRRAARVVVSMSAEDRKAAFNAGLDALSGATTVNTELMAKVGVLYDVMFAQDEVTLEDAARLVKAIPGAHHVLDAQISRSQQQQSGQPAQAGQPQAKPQQDTRTVSEVLKSGRRKGVVLKRDILNIRPVNALDHTGGWYVEWAEVDGKKSKIVVKNEARAREISEKLSERLHLEHGTQMMADTIVAKYKEEREFDPDANPYYVLNRVIEDLKALDADGQLLEAAEDEGVLRAAFKRDQERAAAASKGTGTTGTEPPAGVQTGDTSGASDAQPPIPSAPTPQEPAPAKAATKEPDTPKEAKEQDEDGLPDFSPDQNDKARAYANKNRDDLSDAGIIKLLDLGRGEGFVPGTPKRKNDVRVVESFAKRFGLRVVFFKGDGSGKIADSLHGRYYGGTSIIYINTESPSVYLPVAVHEAMHFVNQNHHDLFQYVADVALEHGVMIEEALERYGSSNEFIARIAGGAAGKESFWSDLAEANPTAFRQFYKAIAKALAYIKKKLRTLSGDDDKFNAEIVDDITAIEKSIAQAFAEASKRHGIGANVAKEVEAEVKKETAQEDVKEKLVPAKKTSKKKVSKKKVAKKAPTKKTGKKKVTKKAPSKKASKKATPARETPEQLADRLATEKEAQQAASKSSAAAKKAAGIAKLAGVSGKKALKSGKKKKTTKKKVSKKAPAKKVAKPQNEGVPAAGRDRKFLTRHLKELKARLEVEEGLLGEVTSARAERREMSDNLDAVNDKIKVATGNELKELTAQRNDLIDRLKNTPPPGKNDGKAWRDKIKKTKIEIAQTEADLSGQSVTLATVKKKAQKKAEKAKVGLAKLSPAKPSGKTASVKTPSRASGVTALSSGNETEYVLVDGDGAVMEGVELKTPRLSQPYAVITDGAVTIVDGQDAAVSLHKKLAGAGAVRMLRVSESVLEDLEAQEAVSKDAQQAKKEALAELEGLEGYYEEGMEPPEEPEIGLATGDVLQGELPGGDQMWHAAWKTGAQQNTAGGVAVPNPKGTARTRARGGSVGTQNIDPIVQSEIEHNTEKQRQYGDVKSSITGAISRFYTMMVDDLHGMKVVVDRALKGQGSSSDALLTQGVSPYHISRVVRGWAGAAEVFIRSGPMSVFSNKKFGTQGGIVRVLEKYKLGGTYKYTQFGQYLRSKRVLEVKKAGGDLSKDVLAKIKKHEYIVSLYEADPSNGFLAAADELTQYSDALLSFAEEMNLLSAEDVRQIRDKYMFYVPLHVIEPEVSGGIGKAATPQATKAVKNMGVLDDHAIMHPVEAMVRNTYRVVNSAYMNRAKLSLAEVARATGDKGLAEIIPLNSKRKKHIVSKEKLLAASEGMQAVRAAVMNAAKQQGLTPQATDALLKSLDDAKVPGYAKMWLTDMTLGDGLVAFIEDGDLKLMKVADEVYDSFKAMAPKDNLWIMKMAAKFTSYLRRGAVLSPEFMARNPMRDFATAVIAANKVVQTPADFFRFSKAFVDGLFSAARKDSLFEEWAMSGGAMADFVSMDRETIGLRTKQLMKSGTAKYLDVSLERLKQNPIGAVLDVLGAASTYTETATRLAVYRTKRDNLIKSRSQSGTGQSDWAIRQIAALESRDATIDFNRMGEKTKALNMLQAFFNAGVQGTDKTVRTLLSPNSTDKAGAWMRLALTMTIPSLLLHSVNKDEEWYNAQPGWLKNMFWLFSFDGGKNIIRIPKPFEYGLLAASLPERYSEYLETKDPRGMKKWREQLLQSAFGGSFSGTDMVSQWFPPLMSLYNINANYDPWRGEQIVKGSLAGVSPQHQYTESTTLAARQIAELLAENSKLKLSPINIDYWIRSSFAGLGKYGMDMISGVMEIAGLRDKHAPDKIGWQHRAPLLKGYLARYPAPYDDRSNEFYEMLETSETVVNTVNTLAKKRFDIEGAIDELEQNGYWYLMAKPLNEVADSIRGISAGIEVIKNDPSGNMTGEQKRSKINSLYKRRSELIAEFFAVTKKDRLNVEKEVGEMIADLRRKL